MILPLPADLARLLRELPVLRRAYLVGGCVRDAILGRPLKDFDVEVFGASYEALAEALRPWGRTDFVGRSFGVIKLSLGNAVHDFSIPRRDSKVGPGHRGFDIHLDPHITPPEAAARRDFTLNALMWDPRSGEVLDFFGGRDDIERRILRHIGEAFRDDPLRVLRGMQLAGRFHLTGAPETLACCRELVGTFHELAFERVRDEWFKWAASSTVPSAGLRWIEAAGWLSHFPELDALRGVPQEPEWHPEGDVFQHTCHALDALPDLPAWRDADEPTRIVVSLAVLTHDFGKATCTHTVLRDGRSRIVSPGHENDSARLAAAFLERLRIPRAIAERVVPLVLQHMAHFQEPGERAVRRLARRLAPETVEHLCLVMTADAFGRPPRPRQTPSAVEAIRRIANRLDLARSAPQPLLLGRHLLALGLSPGKEIGRWTHAAFEAQLDGRFHDLNGAHAWLAGHPDFPPAAAARAAETTSEERG
ncbi:MAG: HD domain-containing protein [Verrucomicrobiae bacterium]|nr:HD domain-containing protein [Verrucomicrobiae bacterium]